MAAKAARRPPARQRPVLVLNGPNLNMLGKRQPEIYGRETLADVERGCRAEAERLGLAIEFFQSNHEGALVDRIQAAREQNAAIVINAGAYTHTSVALLDASRTGVVLSAIQGRDYARIYIKELDDGRAAVSLSPEEQQAVDRAMKSLE